LEKIILKIINKKIEDEKYRLNNKLVKRKLDKENRIVIDKVECNIKIGNKIIEETTIVSINVNEHDIKKLKVITETPRNKRRTEIEENLRRSKRIKDRNSMFNCSFKK